MKLDRSFTKEIIKTANGDGSREEKFRFLRQAKAAANEMSSPAIITDFGAAVKKHGRATVAVCVASTILKRQDRLEHSTVCWAHEVMKLWTNRPSDFGCVAIRDGLHPTRIEEYAGSFIRLTKSEG